MATKSKINFKNNKTLYTIIGIIGILMIVFFIASPLQNNATGHATDNSSSKWRPIFNETILAEVLTGPPKVVTGYYFPSNTGGRIHSWDEDNRLFIYGPHSQMWIDRSNSIAGINHTGLRWTNPNLPNFKRVDVVSGNEFEFGLLPEGFEPITGYYFPSPNTGQLGKVNLWGRLSTGELKLMIYNSEGAEGNMIKPDGTHTNNLVKGEWLDRSGALKAEIGWAPYSDPAIGVDRYCEDTNTNGLNEGGAEDECGFIPKDFIPRIGFFNPDRAGNGRIDLFGEVGGSNITLSYDVGDMNKKWYIQTDLPTVSGEVIGGFTHTNGITYIDGALNMHSKNNDGSWMAMMGRMPGGRSFLPGTPEATYYDPFVQENIVWHNGEPHIKKGSYYEKSDYYWMENGESLMGVLEINEIEEHVDRTDWNNYGAREPCVEDITMGFGCVYEANGDFVECKNSLVTAPITHIKGGTCDAPNGKHMSDDTYNNIIIISNLIEETDFDDVVSYNNLVNTLASMGYNDAQCDRVNQGCNIRGIFEEIYGTDWTMSDVNTEKGNLKCNKVTYDIMPYNEFIVQDMDKLNSIIEIGDFTANESLDENKKVVYGIMEGCSGEKEVSDAEFGEYLSGLTLESVRAEYPIYAKSLGGSELLVESESLMETSSNAAKSLNAQCQNIQNKLACCTDNIKKNEKTNWRGRRISQWGNRGIGGKKGKELINCVPSPMNSHIFYWKDRDEFNSLAMMWELLCVSGDGSAPLCHTGLTPIEEIAWQCAGTGGRGMDWCQIYQYDGCYTDQSVAKARAEKEMEIMNAQARCYGERENGKKVTLGLVTWTKVGEAKISPMTSTTGDGYWYYQEVAGRGYPLCSGRSVPFMIGREVFNFAGEGIMIFIKAGKYFGGSRMCAMPKWCSRIDGAECLSTGSSHSGKIPTPGGMCGPGKGCFINTPCPGGNKCKSSDYFF